VEQKKEASRYGKSVTIRARSGGLRKGIGAIRADSVESEAMTVRSARPASVAEYIEAAPKEARKKLQQMRACILKAAPGAMEGLKWGMPAFSFKRILVTFAAHKNHIGFYPTPSAVKAFAKELSKFNTARGSIQFPLQKPLPLPLIRKITACRVQESLEQDRKWRT
jgi:uncharacterized protein YdhG (YjbR/CyaY superfamily)